MFREKSFVLLLCFVALISNEEVDKKLKDEKSANEKRDLWTFCSDPEIGAAALAQEDEKKPEHLSTITHTIKKSSKEAEVLKMSFVSDSIDQLIFKSPKSLGPADVDEFDLKTKIH